MNKQNDVGGVDVAAVMTEIERFGRAYCAYVRGGNHEDLEEANRIYDGIPALLASPAAVGWQPIETAPKDGTAFIATGLNYGKDSGPRHYCMALWEQGEWREASEWNGHSSLAYLTHWQPLPSPPAKRNAKRAG